MTDELAAKIALLEVNRAIFGETETDRLIETLRATHQPPPVSMEVTAV